MKILKKDTLSELVYDKIKLIISDGMLTPGQKINKKELEDTLGVSQTPITEAINRLTGEGLIEQRNREGSFIKIFTYHDLKELFAIRAGLEGIAVRLCLDNSTTEQLEELFHLFSDFSVPMDNIELKRYLKADKDFHARIVALSGNSIIKKYNSNYDFILKSYQKGLIRPPEETLEEHRQIILAIKERKELKAQELMIEHFLKSRHVIQEKHIKFK